MSQVSLRFIEAIPALTPVNAPLGHNDRLQEALYKLQGQINFLLEMMVADDSEYPSVKVTATAAGDNLLLECPAGKRIVLRRIVAIADPDDGITPEMRMMLGSEEVYRSVVIALKQKITGPANGDLVLNLSEAAIVPVTAFYELIDA